MDNWGGGGDADRADSACRLRPNIVVQGSQEWEEDMWKEITIGDAGKFFLVSRCPRCQLPKYAPWGKGGRGVNVRDRRKRVETRGRQGVTGTGLMVVSI